MTIASSCLILIIRPKLKKKNKKGQGKGYNFFRKKYSNIKNK